MGKRSGTQDNSEYQWFHGDCLNLLKELSDDSVQLVFTSPPYNIKREYEEKLDMAEYLNHQELIIRECVRILKDSGSLCWQVGTYTNRAGDYIPLDLILYRVFARYGFKLRNRIIWHFEHGFHARHKFSGRYETILWFTRSDDYVFNLDPIRVPQKNPKKKFYKGPNKGKISSNPLGKNPGDVWAIPNVKNGNPEKIVDGHPCQFPIELAERVLLALTNPGDVVVDPFAGTASTLIAALRHGRVAIGSEIDKKYHRLGQQRINKLKRGTLAYNGPFDELKTPEHYS